MALNNKRAGRKSLSGNGKSEQDHLIIGEPLRTNVKKYCEAYNIPFAAFIRMATEKEYMARINNVKTP